MPGVAKTNANGIMQMHTAPLLAMHTVEGAAHLPPPPVREKQQPSRKYRAGKGDSQAHALGTGGNATDGQ